MADLFTYQWLQALFILVVAGMFLMLLSALRVTRAENNRLKRANRSRNLWWWQHPDVLVSLDSRGRVVEANRPFFDHDLAPESEFAILFPVALRQQFLQALETTLAGGDAGVLEFELPELEASGLIRLSRDTSKPGYVMMFIQDTSERFEELQQLRQDKLAAEQSNNAKSRFLANMSHEIRTPMTGLLGMVSLMEQTPLDEEQQGYQRVIHSSSEHLLAIINDILDISKIDAGKLSIEQEEFDLHELVQSLLDMVSAKAQEKRLTLQSFVDDKLPQQLIGDPMRIRQILMNYLNNAIKFTEQGHVLLRAVLIRDRDSNVAIRFSVEDTGIGIGASRAVALFEEYSFAHGRISTEAGGTGLGLSICQRLAKLMDGKVGVVSTPGSGSNFWFDVSLPVAFRADVPRPSEPGSVSGDMWICDDQRVHRTLLASVARSMNMLAREFSSTAKVLEALQQNPPPAVLVMSQQCWRESDDNFRLQLSQRRLLVAMTSSDGIWEPRDVLLQQGIRACWEWPMSQANVKSLLRRLLVATPEQLITRGHLFNGGERSASLPAAEPGMAMQKSLPLDQPHQTQVPDAAAPVPDAGLLEGCRVLLAEDNPVNQKVASQMLKRLGCEVELAVDGLQAVAITAEQSFELVLMDCHMPNMDGLEASRKIRQREQQQDQSPLLIVALSADVMADRKGACEAAGMNGYLAKPIRLEDLKRELPVFLAAHANTRTDR